MSHSPNLDKLDQEAFMQNIDRLVEAIEMEAKESGMSKRRKLFSDEASSSAVKFYQPLDRGAIDFSRSASLRKLVDFLVKGECNRIVPPFEVEAEFLKQTGHKYKKDAWMVGKANRSFCLTTLVLLVVAHVDPRMVDYRPDWHMWVSFEIRGHLGHGGNDKFSGGKFREGWEAIVRIITADFQAKQATGRHEPLLLEARNAFINTKAEWDNEKGELVREREALKEELNKAKEMAVEAEQRTKVVRLEKEVLQQQYTKDKAEWRQRTRS
ncbi:hypothetical protein R1flu_028711 [Riccia fluitans]|uniref:Uncharacterized protein n=1 Tax=Riccia fluitans TaxID=41844 RepID=A0ABD1XRI5_9MARC